MAVTLVEELLIKEKNNLEKRLMHTANDVAWAQQSLAEATEAQRYAEERYAEVIRSLSNAEAL